MWLESVKKRLAVNGLDRTADTLERSGVIKDLYVLIRQSKALVPSNSLNDFLSIVNILTEEVWKEQRRVSSVDPSLRVNLSSTMDPDKTNRSMSKGKSTSFGDLHSPHRKSLSILYSSRKTDGKIKYKSPVSEEVAYMVIYK